MPARYLIAALVALLCAACFGLAAGDQSPWLQFAATVAGILLLGAIASRAIAGLASRGAKVLRVPLYRWALPEDTRPLRDAVSRLAGGSVDFLLFTSSRQVDHVMEIAAELGLASAVHERAVRLVVASIGPVCSETLHRHGLPVDLEPDHPKMGHLLVAVARRGRELLEAKRAAAPPPPPTPADAA